MRVGMGGGLQKAWMKNRFLPEVGRGHSGRNLTKHERDRDEAGVLVAIHDKLLKVALLLFRQ